VASIGYGGRFPAQNQAGGIKHPLIISAVVAAALF
jgi:hypothetical protein